MKYLFGSLFLLLCAGSLHAQMNAVNIGKPTIGGIDLRHSLTLDHAYSFANNDLLYSYFKNNGTRLSNSIPVPGYYRQNELLSAVSMCSSVGSLQFHTSYYFNNEGQLQDGEITISKKRKK